LNRLYSACYDYQSTPFDSLTRTGMVQGVLYVEEMKDFDSALILWGGSDISPEFYRHPMSRRCAPHAGRRDLVEWALLQEAVEMEIPIIGVCRGAQMLCAAAGGFLIQDVNHHAGPGHDVITFDGKRLKTNSLHHQMMVPYKTEHELIAWSEKNIGAPYIYRDDKLFNANAYGYSTNPDTDVEPKWREPEFVYFKKLFGKAAAGYAVQWHPEMMSEKCEATAYILDFIKEREAARAGERFYVHQEKKMEKKDAQTT
jgi:gamma-glutamyl-gamma-aminobutyrate hydrolase PuuD